MADRIYSIDAMRIVAMVFIVMIHTDPFVGLSATGNMATFVIKTTARFAVPFFFMSMCLPRGLDGWHSVSP